MPCMSFFRARRLTTLLVLIGLIAVAVLVWMYATGRFSKKNSAPELAAPQLESARAVDLSSLPAGLVDSLRFMGPTGDGVVSGFPFNMDWKAHPPREVWRKPVGLGWA